MSVVSIIAGAGITCGVLLLIICVLELIDSYEKEQKEEVAMPSELDALWLASTIRTDGAFEKIAMDKRAAKAKNDIENLVIGDMADRLDQLSKDIKQMLERTGR